jgi:hypothetical protein
MPHRPARSARPARPHAGRAVRAAALAAGVAVAGLLLAGCTPEPDPVADPPSGSPSPTPSESGAADALPTGDAVAEWAQTALPEVDGPFADEGSAELASGVPLDVELAASGGVWQLDIACQMLEAGAVQVAFLNAAGDPTGSVEGPIEVPCRSADQPEGGLAGIGYDGGVAVTARVSATTDAVVAHRSVELEVVDQ